MAESLKIWHMKSCPLFASLGPDEMHEFDRISRMVEFREGQEIPLARDPEAVWVVKRGRVRLDLLDERGKETTLLLLGPGDFFGAITEDRAETCERAFAFGASVLCRVNVADWKRMVQRHLAFSMRVTRLSLFRIRRLESRLGDLLMKSAAERLAFVLSDLAPSHAAPADIAVTHANLARLVGTSREMVTILLSRMRRKGLVEPRRGRVRILDFEGLRRIAKGAPVPAAGDGRDSFRLPAR